MGKSYKFSKFIRTVISDIRFYAGKRRISSYLGNLLINPSLQFVLLYRLSHFFYCKGLNLPACALEWLQHIFFASRIEKRAQIGMNFRIPHPTGIIIGIADIGDDVTIFQNVTIGGSGRKSEKGLYPHIKGQVKIYAGAVIIGSLTIGDGATVAALSLVNREVPARWTAIGIPAHLKPPHK